ncbi:MerR family transcriptional regulator [Clostridium lundense]|uniref:MerR family transcriptional regulator n=1 Tax=Clostridium lundense TaxID=319475 RepID=UPI000481F319|nr:MerR family transcriptional regulator [Clostridium lundense]
MFRIEEFANLNKISIKTLRYYDELGLLKPMEVDWQTGYRYYSAKQLPRLNGILALKDLGFSLNQIGNVIDNEESRDIVLSMLDEKKKEINDTINSENISMTYNALIKWIEENGYKIAGSNRELYLEGEWSTPNIQEYITEIQIPVEKI